MKHITHHQFYGYEGKAWRINVNGGGIRTDILRGLLGQLVAMLSHHRKVFVFRFDLSSPTYTPTNKIISDFNRRLKKRIKAHYKVKRIGYGWAREQEKSKQQHYHYVLLLDGSKVNTPHKIQQWIEEILKSLDSRPHWAGYHNITRNNEEQIQAVSHHISYLAKSRGKGYRPTQTKDFRASNLKLASQ